MSYWEDEPKEAKMKKPKRNEPCLCASGRKWKHCCGKKLEQRRTEVRQEAWRRFRQPRVEVPIQDDTQTDEALLAAGQDFDKELAEERQEKPQETASMVPPQRRQSIRSAIPLLAAAAALGVFPEKL